MCVVDSHLKKVTFFQQVFGTWWVRVVVEYAHWANAKVSHLFNVFRAFYLIGSDKSNAMIELKKNVWKGVNVQVYDRTHTLI